jgi:Protein of unknown function (DUF1553)
MLFDWPEHLVSIGQRSTTTVAPQALLFLNGPQGRHYAEAFAQRLEGGPDPVERGYRIAVGRPPDGAEKQLALAFLSRQADGYRRAGHSDAGQRAQADLCQALLGMNEFVYVD